MVGKLAAIYKNRYTLRHSVIKIGTLYQKNRYIFDLKIGTHCIKIGTFYPTVTKIGKNVKKIGSTLRTCYLYR